MQPSSPPPNTDRVQLPSPSRLRGWVVFGLGNPYVAAILCAVALLWTVSTLAEIRDRFDEFGFRGDQNDFVCYYIWAAAMRENVNPYVTDLRETALKFGLAMGHEARADYPPTFVLCLEPLTLLSFKTAYWLWLALNGAALVLVFFLLLGKESGLSVTTGLTLAALAVLYKPFLGNLGWGQPHTILLAMMVMAGRWFRQGKDARGGFILAFAGLLKVYPLFLVGYLIVTRRWRATFFTVLGVATLTAATVALIGSASSVAFAGRLVARARGDFLAAYNLTLDPRLIDIGAVVSRLFAQLAGGGPDAATDWIRQLLVRLAQIALLGLTAYATAQSRTTPGRDERAFALWTAAAVLLSPTAWVHYIVVLLFPLLVLAVAAIRGQASSLAIWLGATGFFLSRFPVIFNLLYPFMPLPLGYALDQNYAAVMAFLIYASAYRLTTEGIGGK